MNKLIINLVFILFAILLSAYLVSAITWELDILAPLNTTTLTNRDVNYSLNYSTTELNLLNGVSLNVTIYRNGSIISGPHNVTNSTFFNTTNTSVNGVFEWFYNITNGSVYNVSDTFEYVLNEQSPDTYVFEILNPNQDGEFNIFLSTSINFSYIVNATGGFLGANEQLSCDVMNRSSTTGPFSILFSNNVTNATFFNRTFTVADDRHQFYVNCSNSFQPERIYGNSLETFFDVNTDFFRLPIGLAENLVFFLDSGNIVTAGNITLSNDMILTQNSRIGIGTLNPLSHLEIEHLGSHSEINALHIDTDIRGNPGTSSVELDTLLTGLGGENITNILDIVADTTGSTGGGVNLVRLGCIGEGSALCLAFSFGADVEPFRQTVGTFTNIEYGVKVVNSTGQYLNITGNLSTTIFDVELFTNINDEVIIGGLTQFAEVELILNTSASGAGVKPAFQHSGNDGGWVPFTPIDSTNGFRQSGEIFWSLSAVGPDWTNTTINGTNGFFIQIKRTQTGLSTSPIESTMKIPSSNSTIGWNSSGYVTVAALEVGFPETPANITLFSLDGTSFRCGVSNSGTFACS